MEKQETQFLTDTVVSSNVPEKQEPVMTTVFLEPAKNKFSSSDPVKRPTWSHPMEYICTTLTYLIGYGAIWRFPYLMYRNGGVTFLIVYCILLGLFGIPMFLLETYIGQFTSNGILTCWEMFPLVKGIGYAMFVIGAVTGIYYSVIIAWTVHYFFDSWRRGELPWARCDNQWNTPNCFSGLSYHIDTLNGTDYGNDYVNEYGNEDGDNYYNYQKKIAPSEEYWNNVVLQISSGIEDMGIPQWQIALPLLAIWVGVALVLSFGPKVYGKFGYICLLIFPLLGILMIRFVTLPGASIGLQYLFYPNVDKMAEPGFWYDVARELFFMFGFSYGPLITLGSYNKYHNNCLIGAILIPILMTVVVILMSITIMALVGFLAYSQDLAIQDVMTVGPGLVFIAAASAFAVLPGGAVWSALFYLLLIIMGASTLMGMVETIITAFLDIYPKLHRIRFVVVIIVSVVSFLLGLPLTCNGGIYLLTLIDQYISANSLLLGCIELGCVVFMYGIFSYIFPPRKALRFKNDIAAMLKGQCCNLWLITWPIWCFMWYGICPLIFAYGWLTQWSHYSGVRYGDYFYPFWANSFGWFLSWGPIALLYIVPPVVVTIRLVKGDRLSVALEYLIKPSQFWGPALHQDREELMEYTPNQDRPYNISICGNSIRIL